MKSGSLVRRALLVGLGLFAAAFVTVGGCYSHHHHGHHGYHHYSTEATLEVMNLASSDVVRVEVEQASGSFIDAQDVQVPPGSGVTFDLASDTYDVTVIFDSGERDTFFDVLVEPESSKTIEVRD